MPKRKSGLGPNWKGFDSYLTEEFKSSVSTSGPLDPKHFDVRDEPTEADKQHAGSATYSFAIEREKERQNSGPDEEPPVGHIPPQQNGVDFNSTRVDWYRYVPNDPNDMTDAGIGTIFMRFIKRGDQYRYDSVPMGVYAAMSSEGASRGKFVNSTLNHYPYSKIGNNDEALLFFSD